jgi:hypothetical protein
MRSVTEFNFIALDKGIKAKAALAAEGKSPEEIQASLGETFKMEGDKLKYFAAALDVAGQNPANLRRVLVVALNEGEAAPAKAVKVEEMHYIPEYLVTSSPVSTDSKGGRGGKGKRRDGPKSSPWGMSPEEKAAKKQAGAPKPKA